MGLEIGEGHRCPECGSVRGKIIWKSRDGETVGIKCPRSSRHKRNSVILVSLKKKSAR